MERKIMKVMNVVTLAGIGLLAGILTCYSVLWLWTIFSPRAHFEAGPIGLVCKIVAFTTIVLTGWLVPSIISYLLKQCKKGVRSGDIMDKYISLIKSKDDTIRKLAAEAANYKVEATHYKAVAEMYKKALDSLESDTEG